jgi:hypothetical protein
MKENVHRKSGPKNSDMIVKNFLLASGGSEWSLHGEASGVAFKFIALVKTVY